MVVEIAVKFVNAMWLSQFTYILTTGHQQYTRSAAYKAALPSLSDANVLAIFTNSTAYNSYMYSGYMLMGWGLYGFTAFFANRFAKSTITT